MASPSRSGSVARYKFSDFFAASVISFITFFPRSLVSHFIWKSFSVSIASFFADKSRTCPTLARTLKSEPKYLLIDFAFDGDSTINTFINFGPKFQFKDNSSRNFEKKYIFTWII